MKCVIKAALHLNAHLNHKVVDRTVHVPSTCSDLPSVALHITQAADTTYILHS
jgi:hypothetical protein